MFARRVLLCCVASPLLSRCLSFSTKLPPTSGFTLGNDGLWESQWVKIEQMRGERKAAVDTMGAEALARRYRSRDANFRFQTLISCMLSPQTRDQQTALAFDNLVTLVAPEPLTAQNLLAYSEQIEQACTPVSFYAVKARNIISASQRCVEQYNNDIPTDIDTLLSFKGVGPKIAYLTFTIAYGKTLGICVDTHVHRISNRLGWVDTWAAKSNGPEKTRLQLESFLPHERWENVNFLIVGFGQNVCFARNPDCGKCGLTSSCKFYNDPKHMRGEKPEKPAKP